MAKFDPSVTSAVAERGIAQRLSVGKMRMLPTQIKVIADLKKQKVHVFNVGPWGDTMATGSTGTFTVPPCPFGTEYVEMLVADGTNGGKLTPPISITVDELIIQNEDSMIGLPSDDGLRFANAMLGNGRGANPAFSHKRWGMFATLNEVPTKEELAEAHAELTAYCQEIVKDAGDMYATDRKLFAKVVRPALHFTAAKVLGRDNKADSPWMEEANPVGRVKCKMCGRMCEPDVATCEAGHIVNAELYTELMAANEAILAAVKPKGK